VATRAKTRLRTSRQESRERIIAAATELMRTTAYGALTVDDVMREAGFGRTIFYRHFDDLADLLMTAGREAFGALLEAERTLSEAAAAASSDSDVVRAAIEPAVAVYERHGPLMRAIAEAAASGDEQIAGGLAAWRERFNDLVADVLRDTVPGDSAETARALNLMNENYLLDAFGTSPRVSRETAVSTLTAIWSAVMAGA
jgi:AcrR family transcriptional regulator